MTGKQRMLNAYRGVFNDRVTIAPEFWYYYPAKVMGADMIAFSREVPFHLALKKTFAKFGCDGWGVAAASQPNARVSGASTDRWLDANTLETHCVTKTPFGELTSAGLITRAEPGWSIERPIKDLARDLPAWECSALGGTPEDMDPTHLMKAWTEVGEAYLLEAWLGVPFFDFLAGALNGGFEAGILLFTDPEQAPLLDRLREKHTEYMVRLARVLCTKTPIESLCIGCSWSCNSLLGPHLWRRWDKPGIRAVAEEVHRHGRLLHVHFHGRCFDTVGDFAEIGIDCVCPFERAPGGDVRGRAGLDTVARLLRGRTTMNGNLHTVETLIRGKPADARREVGEIMAAFAGNPRVIVGTGDQVGRETPEENLHAMIAEAARLSPAWRRA